MIYDQNICGAIFALFFIKRPITRFAKHKNNILYESQIPGQIQLLVVIVYFGQVHNLYQIENVNKQGEKIMTEIQAKYTSEKFQNAEQIWFWFLYSKSVRNDIGQNNGRASTRRVCELVDVETLITKLYLSGKLTDAQLAVMKEFGDRRRAPHQYVWRENHAAAIWNNAMNTLDAAARAKGWIE